MGESWGPGHEHFEGTRGLPAMMTNEATVARHGEDQVALALKTPRGFWVVTLLDAGEARRMAAALLNKADKIEGLE